MESWEKAFRKGFAPTLPTAGLENLALALEDDDQRLIQGATTSPPPLISVRVWPVEAACGIGFCGWQDDTGTRTNVEAVEEFFAQACFNADQRLGDAGACRFFLNWFDETPREEVRVKLLPVVQDVLAQRLALEQGPLAVAR